MEIENQGYRAFTEGKNLIQDNPYRIEDQAYWSWRSGWLDAYMGR